jgi:hypothetical protein
VIADLLSGRFDYVYMGLTCVGHLRFFTRRSIEGMLEMTGWRRVSIEPQALGMSTQGHDLIEKLTAAGLPFSREDLTASGYYVIAQKS